MKSLNNATLRRAIAQCFVGAGQLRVLPAAALALTLAAPTAVIAQETSSSIRGKVLDASGNSVANAAVIVQDMRTGVERGYATNGSGTFLATRLPVGGPYEVTVNGNQRVQVPSVALGEIYNLTINLQPASAMEELVVLGQATDVVDVAAGPSATFGLFELETSVAINRDISDVYAIDPRLNLDTSEDGVEVNCAGKHPRFNSITLDGVSQNDRFGLNDNGYSTAVGQPFPFDALQQVAVELAPFDVTYGGFSACNINAVTKSGTNEFSGNVFYEYTTETLKGDEIGGFANFDQASYQETTQGFTIGGPIIKDKLFFFAAYAESDQPRNLARGFNGSGVGVERPWLSETDFNRINTIANSVYNYDPGGLPSDGAQEDEKYLLRLDWNISDAHNAALIYNYYDGFQDRDSDGDPNEFEFANHFYQKGSESETITVKLSSQWTDAFSTEVFYSKNEMNDSQVTVGPQDFADFQISINRDTVYLGADDSRQANALNTESEFFKLVGQLLIGDHVITGGIESEELTIFNQFVQHSRGGEYDFFDDSGDNSAACALLTAQGRFDDATCGTSGIDKFELGRPSRIYYGSGGGTNNADDAAANFSNRLNAIYLQDEFFWDAHNLTLVAGLRYEVFDSSDRPNFNQAFFDANGIRNDSNVDGVDILMPRFGFTWEATDQLSVRGGLGLFSGGNPNVWISNAWSNDGLTNVQLRLNNFDGAISVLGGEPLVGQGRPGFDVPQQLFDDVAAVTPADGSTRRLVLLDPDYEQPSELKFALGATYEFSNGVMLDADILHTQLRDSAFYVDLSQDVVGQTAAGAPIYDYTNGEDNLLLTNSDDDASASVFSVVFTKEWDNGLDMLFGYAYTDAEDVSPMTSSTGGSNFDSTALLDINNPQAAGSNYVVPHRLTLRASYGKEFFKDYESRVTLMGYASEGQPQSLVMGGGDLEGDGFFGRHLLYVPNGAGDPNVVFAPGFDVAAFNRYVDEQGLGAGFQERNVVNAKWSTRFDLRLDQELPSFFGDTYGKLYLKIRNVGNLLNPNWGKITDANFFSQQVIESSVDAQGRYVFEEFNGGDINDVQEDASLWEARIGIEFRF